jgi:hypothetical protein
VASLFLFLKISHEISPSDRNIQEKNEVRLKTPDAESPKYYDHLSLLCMVNRQLQDEMKDKVEDLFSSYRSDQGELILTELGAMGFVRVGGNPAAISMENTRMELFVLIGVDEEGRFMNHETVTFDQIMRKK